MVGFGTKAVAVRLKEPLLEFDDEEKENTAKAGAHVLSFFDIPVSPLNQALVVLGTTIIGTYVAKYAVIKATRELTKESNANVVDVAKTA